MLLGLCYLAAVTRKAGFLTEIMDIPALGICAEDALKLILDKNPEYVGFSAVSLAVENAAKLAEEIKRRAAQTITLLGGSHISALPEQTMERYPQFDFGVIGEGEETIACLLEALRQRNSQLSVIKGIIYRDSQGLVVTPGRSLIEDIDLLPMPAWDLLPDIRKHYLPTGYAIKRLPSFSLVTSRGCSYHCLFCDRSVFGNKYRRHSSQYIIDMLENLIYNYGIRDIRFNDDEFMLDKAHLRELCQKMIDKKLKLSWSCLGRVDDVDSGLLRMMKRAGCWQIRYGIESGSQKVLDAINKRINLKQAEEAVSLTRGAGIKTIGFFMMGLPTETEQDIQETIAFALKLKLDDFKINFLAPFPGSRLFREIAKYGRANFAWSELHMHKKPSFIPYGLSEESMIKYNRIAFRKFYLRPKVILSHIRNIRGLGGLKAGLKGFWSLLRYTLVHKNIREGLIKGERNASNR